MSQSGTDKVGENSWLSQSPFEVLPLSSLSSPAVSHYITELCVLLSFPVADSFESISPITVYIMTDFFYNDKICHSCESLSASSFLGAGNNTNCELWLYNTDFYPGYVCAKLACVNVLQHV